MPEQALMGLEGLDGAALERDQALQPPEALVDASKALAPGILGAEEGIVRSGQDAGIHGRSPQQSASQEVPQCSQCPDMGVCSTHQKRDLPKCHSPCTAGSVQDSQVCSRVVASAGSLLRLMQLPYAAA